MLWPVSVTLDGVEIDLADLSADMQIHHGRTGVFDAPAASTCQIVLAGVTDEFVFGFRVGVQLEVHVANGGAPLPRFTGRVTDATLDVDALTVIATGKLADLSQEIGLVDWPSEPWADRVERIFTEAGLEDLLVLQMPGLVFNPVLAARGSFAGGPTTLDDELGSLASMVGASVTDMPDGRILVQPLGERDFDAVEAPGHNGRLDPADVAYAPVWSQVLPAGNIVTVVYTPGTTLPSRTGTLTDGSPTVTGLSSTVDLVPGIRVTGIGIPHDDTVIERVVNSSQITLSRPANISASKDGAVSVGETEIDSISDTSDLSVGMTVTRGGDLQAGTLVSEIRNDSVLISKAAVGSHVGAFTFTAPASAVLTFAAETAYVTHQDDESVALFGERPVTVETTFVDTEDADRRATERLDRVAMPTWNISSAPILRGLELLVGYPVVIRGMPASAPATDWLAILEGWSEQITGDQWTMELALSDPVLSGLAILTWTATPAEYAWNELDPTASWSDAKTLEAILP